MFAPSGRLARGAMAAVCTTAILSAAACTSGGSGGSGGSAASPSAEPSGAGGPGVSPQPSLSPSAGSPTPSAAATTAADRAEPAPTSTWPDLPPDRLAWRDKPKGAYAADAEEIHTKANDMLNRMETTYGSQHGAKCWPDRPTMWTDQCTLGATKAEAAAKQSLEWIKNEPAATFTTLRANAAKVTKAAGAYRTNGCASDPKADTTRKACQDAAYTIAQAYNYLRDGFNAALEAR
ncbi:hypothetical protein ACPA54_05555 [Uniformispora flossi]|uniref:hypothetical protein n=1 Tax=Uniformispora flossi TaxID=3390723 RepID=UPI003C2F085F